jgi:hypothetical protein
MLTGFGPLTAIFIIWLWDVACEEQYITSLPSDDQEGSVSWLFPEVSVFGFRDTISRSIILAFTTPTTNPLYARVEPSGERAG